MALPGLIWALDGVIMFAVCLLGILLHCLASRLIGRVLVLCTSAVHHMLQKFMDICEPTTSH